jgi:hypothetical protein
MPYAHEVAIRPKIASGVVKKLSAHAFPGKTFMICILRVKWSTHEVKLSTMWNRWQAEKGRVRENKKKHKLRKTIRRAKR